MTSASVAYAPASLLQGKRITKRGWVTLVTSAGALIVAAAITAPPMLTATARGAALDELAASEQGVTAAYAELTASYTDLNEVREEAAIAYDAATDFLRGAGSVAAVKTARADLAEVATLTVTKKGASVELLPAGPAPQTLPASMAAVAEQVEANETAASELVASASAIAEQAGLVRDQTALVNELIWADPAPATTGSETDRYTPKVFKTAIEPGEEPVRPGVFFLAVTAAVLAGFSALIAAAYIRKRRVYGPRRIGNPEAGDL